MALAKFATTKGGKSIQVKRRLINRTMTAGTIVATLPRGSVILELILAGTASDAGTTATVSVGSTAANANEFVSAVSVLASGLGNGVNLLLGGQSGASKLTAALTPLIVAANTTAEQLFTVAGVLAGDVISVNKPTAQAGLGIVGVRASAANQVGITFSNNTVAGITPTAAETYSFGVSRAGSGAIPSGIGKMVAGGIPTTTDTQIFVKYAETGGASSVGDWVLYIIYTTGNDINDDTI